MQRLGLHTFLFWFLVSSSALIAQIKVVGEPPSFSQPGLTNPPTIELSAPDVEALLIEDLDRDREGENLRDAVAIPLNRSLLNAGQWDNLSNGDRIWRMGVKIPEAISLEAYYSTFQLPEGAELYVYPADRSAVLGAYTALNNKVSGAMSTDIVLGEHIVFEYFEPSAQSGQGVLVIQDIAYRYRDVTGDGGTNGNSVGSCNVSVACPEAQSHAEAIKSTLRIRSRINGQFFWSTGTLMNTTAADCRPLVLTSLKGAINEQVMSSHVDLEMYRFYFVYESINCLGLNGDNSKSMVGSIHIADSNDGGGQLGSDYLVLEILGEIPSSYQPYFAGWNAANLIAPGGGVAVHHPSGGVKMISTYATNPQSSDWVVQDTHWSVTWSATANGHGVTESGSRGAGLFDAQGRLVGTLTGASSACSEEDPEGQNRPDFFGKLSYHWESNPTPFSEKLSQVLDPASLGLLQLDGSDNPCLIDDIAEYQAFPYTVFPNPSEGEITIQLEDGQGLEIITVYDGIGRMVHQEAAAQQSLLRVDLSHLSSGIYSLLLQRDGQLSVTPLAIR